MSDSGKVLILLIVTIVGVGLLLGDPAMVSAQQYELLEPIPLGENINEQVPISGSGFVDYIRGAIQLTIGIATLLSVLMIVIGGLQYMTTDATGGKSQARDRITRAIGGLLLALSAYIILNTINPSLVEIRALREANVTVNTADDEEGVDDPAYQEMVETWNDYLNVQVLPDEDDARDTIASMGFGIKPMCESVTDRSCVLIAGIKSPTINALSQFKQDCQDYSGAECSVFITGGTEWWCHDGAAYYCLPESDPNSKDPSPPDENVMIDPRNSGSQHRPRYQWTQVTPEYYPDTATTGYAVDLRKNNADNLNTYITEGNADCSDPNTACSPSGFGPTYNDFSTCLQFVDEETHWHVTYEPNSGCDSDFLTPLVY